MIPLAELYPIHHVVGLESSWVPFWISKARVFICRSENVSVLCHNFFSMPLQDAGLVICYLYPGAMVRLKEKFEKELRPGTWVISNTFAIPGWKPELVCEVDDIYRSKVYVYRV